MPAIYSASVSNVPYRYTIRTQQTGEVPTQGTAVAGSGDFKPWSELMANHGFASGVLVSPSIVMLTAHNFSALNRDTGRVTDFLAPASMTLDLDRGHSINSTLTTQSSLETLAATVGGAVYPRGTNFNLANPQNDLAFLRLSSKSAETQINKKMAIAVFHGTDVPIATTPALKDVYNLGYPADPTPGAPRRRRHPGPDRRDAEQPQRERHLHRGHEPS